jgi:NADH-quinone oxidoreductase subunit M
MENLLIVLVFLPIISGALFLFFRSRIAKYSAFVISVIELITAVAIFLAFLHHSGQQFYVDIPWIKEWGIHLELNIDGINILLMLLTGIAIPLILLAGWEKNYHNYGLMDGMVLILQGSLMGVYLSFNAFVYYIFWEMTLIPAYIILLIWGGDNRMRITLKFFIYTLAGSLFMLVALISLYLSTPGEHSFSFEAFRTLNLDAHRQFWLFLAFMLAFMIKTPVFPFHSWQPETYTQAPSAGTMLLGGLMSKMGIFSMLRWLFPVLPLAVREYAPFVMGLAVISAVYASVIALQQKNIKTLFAYSSIAHLSVVVAAIFTMGNLAIQGALLMMFSHGITIIALFFMADIIKMRTDSQWLPDMGGFRSKAPVFAALYLIILLASVGFPLTSGFPGELLMITGLVRINLWLAVLTGFGLILGAVYMLVSYKSAMLGATSSLPFFDLNAREKLIFAILIALIFLIGIFPSVFLKTTENSVNMLVNLFVVN